MKLKLVKQNKRKIVRFTNYNYLIFLFSLGTKLKQCFADFEVQSKKHMKEKFLADLNKIRDNKSGDDLADGLYFFFKLLFQLMKVAKSQRVFFLFVPSSKKLRKSFSVNFLNSWKNLIDCF